MTERWATFEIGEVFPAHSLLSRWIAGLSLIANDLVLINVQLLQAIDADADESPEAVFYFWLACAHFREAAKFLGSSTSDQTIRQFIARLPRATLRQWRSVRKSFDPWPGSFVQRALKPLRDHIFHYPPPTDKDWERILAGVSDKTSGVRVLGEETIGNTRGVFADEIRAEMLGVYLGQNHEEIGESMRLLSQLIGSTVFFARESSHALSHGRS